MGNGMWSQLLRKIYGVNVLVICLGFLKPTFRLTICLGLPKKRGCKTNDFTSLRFLNVKTVFKQ